MPVWIANIKQKLFISTRTEKESEQGLFRRKIFATKSDLSSSTGAQQEIVVGHGRQVLNGITLRGKRLLTPVGRAARRGGRPMRGERGLADVRGERGSRCAGRGSADARERGSVDVRGERGS